MPNPTKGDVHVNRPLTNISIAYMQSEAGFIADRVFPNIPVQKQSDRYFTYAREDFNRDEMEVRASGSETPGAGYDVDSTPTYYAPIYGYHKDIADDVRANTDVPLQPDREASIFVSQKALIKRERTWATKYFTTTVWATDITGVASSPTGNQALQWNDAASTPIEDIRAAIRAVQESTGFKPNTLVLGAHVLDALMDNPEIVDRVKYGTQNQVSTVDIPELMNLLKIPRILVAEAIVNTAERGATEASSFILGKHALLCYSAPNPGLMTPSAGYTFSWVGYLGAGAQGQRIKQFRMEPIASDRVEIEMAYDQKVVASDLGYFWSGIVA